MSCTETHATWSPTASCTLPSSSLPSPSWSSMPETEGLPGTRRPRLAAPRRRARSDSRRDSWPGAGRAALRPRYGRRLHPPRPPPFRARCRPRPSRRRCCRRTRRSRTAGGKRRADVRQRCMARVVPGMAVQANGYPPPSQVTRVPWTPWRASFPPNRSQRSTASSSAAVTMRCSEPANSGPTRRSPSSTAPVSADAVAAVSRPAASGAPCVTRRDHGTTSS